MKLKLLQRWDYLLLAFLVAIIFVSHTLYVSKTFQFPEMDEHLYIGIATEFYKLLLHPSFDTPYRMNQYLVDHPPFRPPIYPLTITAMIFLFGIEHSYKLALWLNSIYYSASIIGVYFLGRQFLSKQASLVASFLFATFGWTLFYLHFTYSETATTTFIVWSLYFLAKSNKFQNKKYSLLFGATLSLGILTRWVAPIFILGPILLSLIKLTEKNARRAVLINLFWIALLIAPAVTFHIINFRSFSSYVSSQALPGPLWNLVPEVRRTLISLQSAAYYFKVFEQLTIFIFMLFLAGLFMSVLKYKKYIFYLLMFLIPYFIFSFGTVIKDDRYIVPIYPSIALLSATVIDFARAKTLRFVLIFCILLLGTGIFLGGVWGIGPMNKGLQSALIKMPIGHPRLIHFTSIVWPPSKDFSHGRKIMQIISDDAKKHNIKQPFIINLFSFHPLDNALFSINNYERLERFTFQNFLGVSPSTQVVVNEFNQANYVLTKTGKMADEYFPANNYVLLRSLQEVLIKNPEQLLSPFQPIATVSVPLDNSKVTIFRKIR